MVAMSNSAAFTYYRREIGRGRELAPAVEQELAERYQRGDRAAARRLVEGCLSTVIAIALEYRRCGLPIEDLVQEGNIGLLKAVERFDPRRGVRLATYAKYWVRAEIRAYVVRHYRVVKLGRTKGEQRAVWLYRRTHEQRPEELAAMAGVSIERITALLPLLMANDVSLTPASDDAPSPLDRLADHGPNAEDLVADEEEGDRLRDAVTTMLAELAPRDRDIVRRRLLADEPTTLEQIGSEWGVSKERVRQLEVSLKTRLRVKLEQFAGP